MDTSDTLDKQKQQAPGGGAQVTVSIVILTWNSAAEIVACLSSLSQALTAFPAEVIVIDNGSHDETCELVRKTLPAARLVCNQKNLGVAPARNQGIRLATGEYVIVLDDDTIVQAGAFERMIRYLEDYPDVGLCGPKLIGETGALHLSCRLFPTLSDKLARRLSSSLARQLARQAEAAEMANWDHASIREVDYVIGACQVIRRRALQTVGLFDERIFYGPEDVDLCLRLQQAGWRVVYNPEAVVVHRERRITRSWRSAIAWKHMRGLSYFFWKHGYVFSRRRLYARLPHRRGRA